MFKGSNGVLYSAVFLLPILILGCARSLEHLDYVQSDLDEYCMQQAGYVQCQESFNVLYQPKDVYGLTPTDYFAEWLSRKR